MGYIKDSSALPSSMTSNTGSNGKASVSTFADNYLHLAFRAFDKNTGTYWQAQSKSGWAKYEFDLPIIISKYSLRATGTINGAPKQWTFEGSNDDQNWIVLDSRTNITNWTSGLIQQYVFSNAIKYKFYRLNIVTTKDDTERIQLSEIDMFELVYYDKFLISSEGETLSIVPGSISTNNIIPIMTSDTALSGRAFAKNMYNTTYPPWKAFNGIDDVEGYASLSGSGGVGYLGYEFPNAISLYKYVVRSNGTSHLNKLPKDWTFEGSNDGVNWVVLDTQANQTWTTQYTDKEYSLDRRFHYIKFKMYRINWTANNGFANYTDINELKMFEIIKEKYIQLPILSEKMFVKYGMSENSEIHLNNDITSISNIYIHSVQLGSGKLFKHKIDTTKHKVHKFLLG
ncbi:discoidin domain-containing protein [Paenibacillus sp. 2KB_22]|uniref:discoidin domain-containing protein n=1 Tax=Paenibacillus sp. 2KB_22 TaxID=3232978 RepID=UPI003F96639A